MNWIRWAFTALYVLLALSNIYTIGKPRKTMTPGMAVIATIVSGLLVWGIWSI